MRRSTVPFSMQCALAILSFASLALVSTGHLGPFLLAPFAAALGPWVTFTGAGPYFTLGFKLAVAAGLLTAGALVAWGLRHRRRPYAWLAWGAGTYLWIFVGFIALGPQ